jgi:hypothetical protein
MDHWLEVFPVKIFEIQYEDLVSDIDNKSKELIAFLGLEWDEKCLSFYETKRPVNTASAWQARQPVYSSSLNRWQHYKNLLSPLKKYIPT